MPNPCIITYNGKDFTHAEFMAALHDGLLEKLVEANHVLTDSFKPMQSLPEGVHYQDSNGNQVVTGEDGLKTVVNKSGKEVSPNTKRKVLASHLDQQDFTKGDKAPEFTEQTNDPQATFKHIVETSKNPAELVDVYTANHQPEALSPQEQAIANYGVGKVKAESFKMFDDRNNTNASMAKSYFDSKGQSLDQVAHEISEKTGVQVEPGDVAEFMKRFPNGQDVNKPRPNAIAKDAAAKFEQLTGFKLTESVAEIARIQKEEKDLAANGLSEQEAAIANKKINDELATQIIKDEGLTLENIDQHKDLFNDFPYSPEDYQIVKDYLHEQRESAAEPTAAGQESTGSDNTQKTSVEGQETQVNQAVYGGNLEPAKQQHYEEIAGSKPVRATGRISVDPIIGEKPKNLSVILRDFAKKVNQKIFYARVPRKAAGTYSPSNAGIKLRYSGDLDTTAHEFGHKLDDVYGLADKIQANPSANRELPYFMASPAASKPPKGHPNPARYMRAEGVAEWLRAYIVNPNQAKRDAPEIHKIYEATVDAQTKKSVEELSTDIRVWAGASGRDITLANIEVKPDEKSIWGKLFGKDEAGKFYLNWTDRLAAQVIQPMQAFNKAFKYAKGIRGIDDVLPENDPVILSRLLLGFNGKFEDIVTNGMIDGKLNRLKDKDGNVKNLNWLLEPLDNTDMGSMQRDMENVLAYMVSERTVELAKRFGRNNIISGTGGGIYKDLDVAKKTLDEFNNGDPDTLKRVQEAASRYRELADDVLKYLVDKGRLAEEVTDKDGNLIGGYKFIKQNNIQYVAMNRIFESEPGVDINTFKGSGNALGSVKQPLFAIKGSSKEIANPYSVLVENMNKSIKEADRNEVMKSFRDMVFAQRDMNQGDVKPFSDIGYLGKEGDKNSVKIFVDGKPETWVFHPEIYKAIKNLDGDVWNLPGIMRLPGQILQFTVTHFPTFAARNVVRDTQDRLIKSTTGSGLRDFAGNKEHWKEVAKAGGLNAGLYYKDRSHYYGLLETTMDDMVKDKKFILADPVRLKELWHKYEDLLYKSETINRVAEYRGGVRQAKEKGMDDYNAMLYGAYKARDLIDFAVAGHTMRIINQVVPFTNAAVQGMRSTISSIKTNPAGFALRTVLYSVLPGAAQWYLNHKDEETAKEYEEIPAYQRDMYYNYKIGDNKWLAIPKPYELSLGAAAIDRTLSDIYNKKEDAYKGYGGTVAKSVLPFDDAEAAGFLRPIVENIANYDFYREKTIIPAHEANLALELRNTQTASRLGQIVQNIAGIDARKVDHFIRGQFSYYGNAAMKLSDVGNEKSNEKFDITDLGFFKKSPAYNSESVQELLKFAKEWNMEQSKDYREFADMATEYFNLKDDKEKEKAGRELIDHAKALLVDWKENNIQQEKINAKKEREEK